MKKVNYKLAYSIISLEDKIFIRERSSIINNFIEGKKNISETRKLLNEALGKKLARYYK